MCKSFGRTTFGWGSTPGCAIGNRRWRSGVGQRANPMRCGGAERGMGWEHGRGSWAHAGPRLSMPVAPVLKRTTAHRGSRERLRARGFSSMEPSAWSRGTPSARWHRRSAVSRQWRVTARGDRRRSARVIVTNIGSGSAPRIGLEGTNPSGCRRVAGVPASVR